MDAQALCAPTLQMIEARQRRARRRDCFNWYNRAIMTKSELIDRLAGRFPQLVAKDCEEAVRVILGAMTDALSQGDRIELRGFGSFSINYRPPRLGRNPKSGEKVNVPEKYVPHFKPGKELRERVDASPVMPAPSKRAA